MLTILIVRIKINLNLVSPPREEINNALIKSQKMNPNRPKSKAKKLIEQTREKDIKYCLKNILTEGDDKHEIEKSMNTSKQGSLRKNSDKISSYMNAVTISDMKNTNTTNDLYNPIPLSVKNYYVGFPNYEATKCSLNSLHYIKAYAANTNQGIVRYIINFIYKKLQ